MEWNLRQSVPNRGEELEEEDPSVASESLDGLNIPSRFKKQAAVMKSIPKFLRGPFRDPLKFALEEASFAVDPARCVRGWKLLVMLRRMLLHRHPGGRVVSKAKLAERFEMFAQGRWDRLIRASEDCDESAAVSRCRRIRRAGSDIGVRDARAEALVQVGELSSARQALEGAELAPGNRATLGALRDPDRRPSTQRDLLPPQWVNFQPATLFELDKVRFLKNPRSSRSGAAAGHHG